MVQHKHPYQPIYANRRIITIWWHSELMQPQRLLLLNNNTINRSFCYIVHFRELHHILRATMLCHLSILWSKIWDKDIENWNGHNRNHYHKRIPHGECFFLLVKANWGLFCLLTGGEEGAYRRLKFIQKLMCEVSRILTTNRWRGKLTFRYQKH